MESIDFTGSEYICTTLYFVCLNIIERRKQKKNIGLLLLQNIYI